MEIKTMNQEFYAIYSWIVLDRSYSGQELIDIISGTNRNYSRFMIKMTTELEIQILSWIIKKTPNSDFQLLMGNFKNHLERKYHDAALWYTAGEKNGNTECLYEHGKMYSDGFLKVEGKKPIDFYKVGADLNNEHCLMEFCKIARENNNNNNIDLILKYYLQGIELGFKQCYSELAQLYSEGIIVEQNFDLANKYFSLGVKNGDIKSILVLGERYNFSKDYEKAIEYFLAGVELNNGKSMFYLAKYYRDGLGVKCDLGKSDELLEKGAKIGDEDCLNTLISLCPDSPKRNELLDRGLEFNNSLCAKILGQKYLNETNNELAFKYFVIGAILQNSDCMAEVGSMYLTNNNEIARKWYSDGARLNNINCILQAAILNENYPGSTKLAKEYYEQGIKLGSTECMFHYGKFLEKTTTDTKIFMDIYTRGAELNNTKCMNRLGLLYEKQGDALTDSEKHKYYNIALKWFAKATVNNDMEALYNRAKFLYKINKKMEALKCYHVAKKETKELTEHKEFRSRCDKEIDNILKDEKTKMLDTYFSQEKRIEELQIELTYKPGGSGYKLCEKSFNHLAKNL